MKAFFGALSSLFVGFGLCFGSDMKTIIPQKLKKGDQIRIVAPLISLSILSDADCKKSKEVLEGLGLTVTFGKHVQEMDSLMTSSVKSRVEDLHDAFADPEVKAIFSAIGGPASNDILEAVDYELIKKNPKILCGYSGLTSLQNAIYHKTGLVSYSGPMFNSLAVTFGTEYVVEYMKKAFFEGESSGDFQVKPSKNWSEDLFDFGGGKLTAKTDLEAPKKNAGPVAIRPGKASGRILGGNLCTFMLLLGTKFMPDFDDSIIFIEEFKLSPYDPQFFNRAIQQLHDAGAFKKAKGLVIGRFQEGFGMSREMLEHILFEKVGLKDIPVISGVDIGHTDPFFTFPIGGQCRIEASDAGCKIELTEY